MSETVIKRFQAQRNRGTQSFGFYLPQQDRLTHNIKETRILALLKKQEPKEALFHHRYATSTINVRNACHPFSTKDRFAYQYVGAHNGVVRNAKELREQHIKLGYEYVSVQENGSFNDSEALIYDLARYFEGEVDTVTASGTIAFIVIKRDRTGRPMTLFFGHNSGNPLVMKRTEHSLTVSSTGEGEHVPINMLHIFDYETKTLRTRDMHIPLQYATRAGGYSYSKSGSPTYRTPNPSSYDDGDSAWNRYMDEKYNVKKTIPLGGNEGEILAKVKKSLENEYNMRPGTKEDIKKEILKENQGKLMAGAISATLESYEAREEQSLMNSWISHEKDEDTQTQIVEYWTNLEEYANNLEEIADELYSKAREEEEAEKTGKAPLGFQVKNTTDPKLLPSTVLANNNKELK